MSLRHCKKCHHEWETANMKCDWCGADSYVLEEVTPFEQFIEELLSHPESYRIGELEHIK